MLDFLKKWVEMDTAGIKADQGAVHVLAAFASSATHDAALMDLLCTKLEIGAKSEKARQKERLRSLINKNTPASSSIFSEDGAKHNDEKKVKVTALEVSQSTSEAINAIMYAPHTEGNMEKPWKLSVQQHSPEEVAQALCWFHQGLFRYVSMWKLYDDEEQGDYCRRASPRSVDRQGGAQGGAGHLAYFVLCG